MTRFAFRHTELSVPARGAWLDGLLSHVPDARALTVFFATAPVARRTAREFIVARTLHALDHATLLVSGLTLYEEQRDPDARYDIPRLTDRLLAVAEWVRHQPALGELPLALHASGNAAAAALRAAAGMEVAPFALVGRSPRIDLAGAAPLRRNAVPTLLIVGSAGDDSVGPARQAFSLLAGDKAWHAVAGASEGFHEPGALDDMARTAAAWLERWRPLRAAEPDAPGQHDTPDAGASGSAA